MSHYQSWNRESQEHTGREIDHLKRVILYVVVKI